MSTKQDSVPQNSPKKPAVNRQAYKRYKELMASSETGDSQEVLVQLLEEMNKVDTSSAEAKDNAESMDDNNGGRIIYTGTPDEILGKDKEDNN